MEKKAPRILVPLKRGKTNRKGMQRIQDPLNAINVGKT